MSVALHLNQELEGWPLSWLRFTEHHANLSYETGEDVRIIMDRSLQVYEARIAWVDDPDPVWIPWCQKGPIWFPDQESLTQFMLTWS